MVAPLRSPLPLEVVVYEMLLYWFSFSESIIFITII